MKPFLVLFISLFLCGNASAAGPTDSVSINNIPKLDRKAVLSQTDFEKTTKVIQETPINNKYLSFKIRLPASWNKLESQNDGQQDTLSKRILGTLIQYLGPPTLDLRSSFRVRANDLSYDVSAKDWFLSYVFSNGYSLEGMDISSEQRIQAQYVMIENNSQYRVRAVALISGPRIMLAEYIVPLEFWSREGDFAKRSMAGFVLTNPDISPIEVMQSFAFVDIAKFNYQSSWVLNSPPITAIERMSASLTNYRGNLSDVKLNSGPNTKVVIDGRIDISTVAKMQGVTLQNEIQGLKEEMLTRKLVLGNLIESVSGWPHHEAITRSHIEVYKVDNVQNKLSDYEQWVGIFETPSRYYFVRLLTIGRQDDFLTWARNIKTYKTVISTLSPVAN